MQTGIELLRLDKIGLNFEEDDPNAPKKSGFNFGNLMRIKNTMVKKTLQNRRKKWNYAEFYEVSEDEDEMKVRAHIEYKKQIKKKDNQSDSDESSDHEEDDKEANRYPDMNDSPDHIISFYYRNLKKYNKIKIFKSALEIQQKIIAAIFITILLFKRSHVVIILYLIYIGYFYFNK